MMTATVLAKKSDVSLYTVRHYTRIGLLKPSRNLRNGYKVYQPSDAPSKEILHPLAVVVLD